MKSQKYFNIKVLAVVLGAILLAILMGCEGKKSEPTPIAAPKYVDWTKYTYRTFTYHFRKDASWRTDMEQYAQAFEKALDSHCEFLGTERPEGPIEVYIYNTPSEAREILGREVPCIVGDTIHWDRLLTPHGAVIMMYLLNDWPPGPTNHEFLYEGLVTLRDYSRRNFHQLAGMFLEEGRLIPIDSLGDSAAYLGHEKQVRSWQAASLVGFITLNFGVDRFKELWISTEPIDRAIKRILGLDTRQLENYWKDYIRREYQNSPKAGDTGGAR